jgi:hypothetical protein
MTRHASSSIGASLAFVTGLLFTCLPLQAQLNPQLQASPTDFLNLFQQASSAKPKPEVVTVFDFSGSMAALMFHPLYVNLDRDDSGSQANMTFVLSGSSGHRVVTATVHGSVVGTRTSTMLIRPDGTQVTETMAGTVSPTGVLYGDTLGAADVRNWIRAASHVRFAYTSGSVTRTVDIPIPWKVTNGASTGNPLSSMTILDQEIKTNPNGTTTTYGSGLQIEVDRAWEIASGSSIFSSSSSSTNSGTSSTQTSTTLMYSSGGSGMYKYAYIDWLFTGKYTSGPYTGQYIVFDAATTGLAGGQTATTDSTAAWGKGYGNAIPATATISVPQFDGSGNYTGEITSPATANVVPAYVRTQAVKRAAIQAWIQNQGDVLWAFRFLDPTSEGSPSGTSIHNNSATTQNVAAGVPTTVQQGKDSIWTVLNNTSSQGITSTTGNSVTGMKRIASLFVGNSTPLTYAVANALAQFNDPNNVFSAVETNNTWSDDRPSACMNHFLIVFTDGVDNNNSGTNNPNGTTPYITGNAVTALTGNQNILANTSNIGRNSAYWNLFTYTGMAAHLSDPNLGSPGTGHTAATLPAANTTASPTTFIPFAIKQRGGVDFGTYGHRITTMTVGVSLGGYYNDNSATYTISPKRNLFFGAAVGDPLTTSVSLSVCHAFIPPVRNTDGSYTYNDWQPDPDDPADYPQVGKRAAGAMYFFDGNNPDLLAKDLQYALYAAKSSPNINSTATPNVPYIGTSFSNEIYLGKFIPSSSQGVLWSGDLLAFSTKTVNDQIVILDRSGNPASTYDSGTAAWSTQAVLSNTTSYPWTGRKLYTRIPGTASVPEHGLSTFTYTGTAYTDATVGLKNFVGTDPNTHSVALTDAQKQAVIQLVSGADLNGPVNASGVPTSNRANLMGDIIDSNPTMLEYKFSDVSPLLSANLQGAAVTGATNHFRLILAGTNQGWLHAFGEVSQQVSTPDPTSTTTPPAQINMVTGKVEELWAFLPTDFLANLDYLDTPNNIHRFMVDGAPTIYFLDLPSPGGGAGDGVVDISSAPGPERAIAIFGLGKGGRSYYAIDIHSPVSPSLRWSIVPDEAAYFPASRIPIGGPPIATVQTVLRKMGFSTCPPALGRVAFNGVLRDVVFFGGGYSNTSVEHNFPVYPNPPATQQTPLGRSVLAVDVYTGEVLAAVDLSSTVSGPIAAGLIPFEFFLNSGMAQRAYFLDYAGGLWSWGSKETATAALNPGYVGFRMDTSDLAYWTTDSGTGGVSRTFNPSTSPGIRKVAQDGTGTSAIYSTPPAPFRVGSFPGVARTTGSASPAAVGIAMISGDRNNPLDYNYSVSNPAPTDHRLTVVFDRQDSRVWGLDTGPGPDAGIADSRLMNFTNQNNPTAPAISPGNASYYLAPTSAGMPDTANTKFGYYINLPTPSNGFIPKGVNSPSAVTGTLFYSYFTPTSADSCTGGTGTTYTNKICDVINPITADTRTTVSCNSGQVTYWVGIASNFSMYGTTGVIQAGAVAVVNPAPGASQTAMQIQTLLGNQLERYPKIRVWRTIH